MNRPRLGRAPRPQGRHAGPSTVSAFARLRAWQPQQHDQLAALVLVAGLFAAALIGLVGNVGGARGSVAVPPSPVSPSATAPDFPVTAAPSTTTPVPAATSTPTVAGCPKSGTASGGSVPAAICIPSLHVSTTIMSLGLNSDNTVQVPPLSRVRDAGWYRYSAVPGDMGPTVILGHVDSAQYGEGVFFRLSSLHAGDQVQVDRGDGRIAVFRIDKVAEVSKRSFPTESVYGPTSGPALRLVTCGGRFDSSTGNYLDNIIAYGTLQSLSDA